MCYSPRHIDLPHVTIILKINSCFRLDTSWLFNYTGVGSPVVADSSVPLIYQLSYNYYIPLGTITGVLVGLVVSYLTDAPDPNKLNPDLFTPFMQRFLANKGRQRPNRNDYLLTVQKDINK